jgi:hypothetical protein
MLCRRSTYFHHALPRSTRLSLSKFRLPSPVSAALSLPSLHLTTQKRHSGTQSTAQQRPALAARIVSSLPPSIKPYAQLARLHAPVGSWLLYWPCGNLPAALPSMHILTHLAWSITLAAAHAQIPPAPLFSMLGLFGIGAVVMRGAGCTINDLWDKNLDKRVRPLHPLLFFVIAWGGELMV